MNIKAFVENELKEARKGYCRAEDMRKTARKNQCYGRIQLCEKILLFIEAASQPSNGADRADADISGSGSFPGDEELFNDGSGW